MNVLIIAEDPSFRLMARHYLIDWGYNVILANNSQEGLKKIKEEKIDLVVAELYMPVIDGLQLCKRTRELPACSDVPFIFLSSYGDESTEAIKMSYINTGFFRKGHSISELLTTIKYLTTPKEKGGGMVHLPASPAGETASAQESAKPLAEKKETKQSHILLVDDDDGIRKVLGILLTDEGYQVSTACDGQEAIDLLSKNKYDLILLDIIMPNVSGFGVLKYVKENNPSTKVIMLTAYSELRLAMESKQMGAEDFVAKPFMRQDLLNTIKNVINS
jgi:DNA-binding response OmpR family regulator